MKTNNQTLRAALEAIIAGVDVAMIDYDCEGSESVADIPQEDGDGSDVYTVPAHVGFLGRSVMPARVAQLWDVIRNVENA